MYCPAIRQSTEFMHVKLRHPHKKRELESITLALEVRQKEVSWTACTNFETQEMHLSVECEQMHQQPRVYLSLLLQTHREAYLTLQTDEKAVSFTRTILITGQLAQKCQTCTKMPNLLITVSLLIITDSVYLINYIK